MKIEKLILHIVLFMSLYNVIVKNYINHFSMKTNLLQTKASSQCSFQIEYNSLPCFIVQISIITE